MFRKNFNRVTQNEEDDIKRETIYTVWFKNGVTVNLYAAAPAEAVIKAQAAAIKDEDDYSVSSVQDQETGALFKVEMKVEAIKWG